MAVIVEPAAEAVEADAPVAVTAEPQRRRVRRKSAKADAVAETAEVEAEAHVEPHPDTAIEPNEAPVDGAPVELDVTPEEALTAEPVEVAPVEKPTPPVPATPQPAVLAEPFVAPTPEIDVAAIIAEDPNQISTPPEKPKRGWWRR
jgi:ribonuclease E